MSGEGSGSPATPSLGASCVHNLLQIVLFRQEHFKQNGRDFFFILTLLKFLDGIL